MTRSEVSKKVRFEVLRRDGFQCRYCGARPPQVELRIDHVVPVTLGGTNDPGNLVTACVDCNAGKGDTPLDAPTVPDVAASVWRWADALQEVARQRRVHRDVIAADVGWFHDRWSAWSYADRTTVPLPPTWNQVVTGYIAAGADVEDLAGLIHPVMTRTLGRLQRQDPFARWRAFDQAARKLVADVHQRTRQVAAETAVEDALTAFDDLTDMDAYSAGHEAGYATGFHDGWESGTRAGLARSPRRGATTALSEILQPTKDT